MERRLAVGAILGPAMGFTINGDQIRPYLPECLYPLEKALLELVGVDAGEHPAKGVVRRDAIGQGEKGCQPGALRLAELFHVNPAVCAADDSTNRDNDDIEQGVVFGAVDPWVVDGRKILANRHIAEQGHRSPPVC